MASIFSDLLPAVRAHLDETTAIFWTDDELYSHMFKGSRDLWRSITDLKQEHYVTIDTTNVSLQPNTGQLTGVPSDVHKIFMIEPLDLTVNGANHGLFFKPLKYNSHIFQQARSQSAKEPQNDTIFYDIFQAGAPVGPPVIVVAPKVTSPVALNFVYIPTLPALAKSSKVPVPGEADQAIIAWTVAYARAKERDDRSPDAAWIQVYSTEKQNLLQSLGLREYQEPSYVEAEFAEYWN
jgi:hypothetical protein